MAKKADELADLTVRFLHLEQAWRERKRELKKEICQAAEKLGLPGAKYWHIAKKLSAMSPERIEAILKGAIATVNRRKLYAIDGGKIKINRAGR